MCSSFSGSLWSLDRRTPGAVAAVSNYRPHAPQGKTTDPWIKQVIATHFAQHCSSLPSCSVSKQQTANFCLFPSPSPIFTGSSTGFKQQHALHCHWQWPAILIYPIWNQRNMQWGGTPISVSCSECVLRCQVPGCVFTPSEFSLFLSSVLLKHKVWSFPWSNHFPDASCEFARKVMSGVGCVLLSHAECSNRFLMRGSSDVTGGVGCINSWIWYIKSSLLFPLCDSMVGNHVI